jgi:hypothetical protein
MAGEWRIAGMPNTGSYGLSQAWIDDFIRDGFLKIEDAFDAELARRARDDLWLAMGLSPDEPETWTRPVVRIGFMAGPAFVAAANTDRLHAAYDALAGEGRWVKPAGLGTFAIRFPSCEDPGDAGWHVDTSFGEQNADFMQWRVNVKSRGRALVMLFLFSDVGPDDAPTRLRNGSHTHVARRLLPRGDTGMSLRELADDGFASTRHCEESLATGPAGTVYLCHPFIVHSAQPNRGTRPRFLAQPPLVPTGEFHPLLPPSPVQLAIRQACGLSF